MILNIVIPAYNEEKSIAGVIKDCLVHKKVIEDFNRISKVNITVVSDGSSDNTVEEANKYSEIQVIELPFNLGYGKALMKGFESSQSDLLAFLDADGTCNAKNFIDMLYALEKSDADMIVGKRLGSKSKMSLLRQIGNRFFAWLIRILTEKHVTDVASGMRLMKTEFYKSLGTMPGGLEFTPCLSMKAALRYKTKVVEVPIDYKMRIGQSKLSMYKDGIGFLKIIIYEYVKSLRKRGQLRGQ